MSAATPSRAIRVVVGTDEWSQRSQLIQTVQYDGDIMVVGEPVSADQTVSVVARTCPDVVILDLHPNDDGSQHAIEQIMAHTPTPILVLCAPRDGRESPSPVGALLAGALDALPRPAYWTPELGAGLRKAVRQISKIQVIRHPRGAHSKAICSPPRVPGGREPVVAIAASTGGPSALATILSGLAGLPAPVLIVQHLHPEFTAGLVEWMQRVSALPIGIAEHGQLPRPGRVYLAPGGLHLRLDASFHLELGTTPDSIHRPSGDELFRSVAAQAGSAGIGVLLTGMGDDGAEGLLSIHRRGGRTLAQDEATSAVFGMPRAAERLGAVTKLLPITGLAAQIRRECLEVLP